MRREERVTVQGPVKEQQPDGMSHRGSAWGFGARGWRGQRGGMRRAWDMGQCGALSRLLHVPSVPPRSPAESRTPCEPGRERPCAPLPPSAVLPFCRANPNDLRKHWVTHWVWGRWSSRAGWNEPAVPSAAVRLGGGVGRPDRWAALWPAESAGRTAARHSGRPNHRPAVRPVWAVKQETFCSLRTRRVLLARLSWLTCGRYSNGTILSTHLPRISAHFRPISPYFPPFPPHFPGAGCSMGCWGHHRPPGLGISEAWNGTGGHKYHVGVRSVCSPPPL